MYTDSQSNQINHLAQLLRISAEYLEQCNIRSKYNSETDSIKRVKEIALFDLERAEKIARKLED